MATPPHDCTIILALLRTWREQGLQMIIAGSISLENMLIAEGISRSVLGGLDQFEVRPFSDEEMNDWLSERAKSNHCDWWASEHSQRVQEVLVDNYPFFGKIAMDELALLKNPEEIPACLEKAVLPRLRREFVYQFDERLEKDLYSPEEIRQAKRLLDAIASQGSMAQGSMEQMITDPQVSAFKLIAKLLRDDFLRENSEQEFDFSFSLLRTYWQQKYKKQG